MNSNMNIRCWYLLLDHCNIGRFIGYKGKTIKDIKENSASLSRTHTVQSPSPANIRNARVVVRAAVDFSGDRRDRRRQGARGLGQRAGRHARARVGHRLHLDFFRSMI